LRISPLDVRNQIFKKKLKGYDIDEVKMFLDAVADCMEEMLKEKETLEREVCILREKANAFSDIESTLRDTMVTAQKISDDARTNAHKEADNIIRDAEIDAKRKICDAMVEVEKLARSRDDARSQTLAFVTKLRSLLEAQLSFLASVEGEIRTDESTEGAGVEVGKDVSS
jgi:cell division initiation protein